MTEPTPGAGTGEDAARRLAARRDRRAPATPGPRSTGRSPFRRRRHVAVGARRAATAVGATALCTIVTALALARPPTATAPTVPPPSGVGQPALGASATDPAISVPRGSGRPSTATTAPSPNSDGGTNGSR